MLEVKDKMLETLLVGVAGFVVVLVLVTALQKFMK